MLWRHHSRVGSKELKGKSAFSLIISVTGFMQKNVQKGKKEEKNVQKGKKEKRTKRKSWKSDLCYLLRPVLNIFPKRP